jgi:acyl-CoA synthetase (AMP-forming)/AMP-acid ligase II
MAQTIPGLLVEAARRDAGGAWLHSDEATLTFAGAAGQVGRIARRLVEAGIRRGDLVVITTRTNPPYLLCWLALASLGAISVPTDPASTPSELNGLIGQVQPKAVITEPGLMPAVDTAAQLLNIDELTQGWQVDDSGALVPVDVSADDLAVLIPTSGTTGRSKLVMQTHRAYAMAGEGFPYWMELSTEDRLLTTLPLFHINAPAYSVMGSLARGAGLVVLPGFSASGFLDAARRHGATQFNAIGAMLEILMRQPVRPDDADTPLRLCYTGPSPAREWQEAFERRFGLRVVCGYALSESPYGLIWRHGTRPFGTLGSPRQHPTLGDVNEARVVNDDGDECEPGRPASCCCEIRSSRRDIGDAGGDQRRDCRRLVAHRRPRDGEFRWHLYVCGPAQGSAAAARAQHLTGGGGGGHRVAPQRAGGRRRRGRLGAHRRRAEGVCGAAAGSGPRLCRALRLDRPAVVSVQNPALLAGHRIAAAHTDRAGGQAPAPARGSGG